MLHPLYLLAGDPVRGVHQTALRVWRPTVLISRSLCLFESLPCEGVAWHEFRGFARLQAQRLAPFERTGVSAARRGKRLMMWFWDEEEARAVLAEQMPGLRARFSAESLYLATPPISGKFAQRGSESVDMLVCEASAIVRSTVEESHPLDLSAIQRTSPWTRDWVGGSLDDRAGPAGGWAFAATRTANAGGMVLAAIAAVNLAFQGGTAIGARKALSELEGQVNVLLASAGDALSLRQAAQADLSWVERYRAASRQLDVEALLNHLRPMLESQGLVVRDMESTESFVRLTVVPAGGDMRLTEVLASLEQMPRIAEVQLVQHTDLSQAIFSFDAVGFWTADPMTIATRSMPLGSSGAPDARR